MSSRSYLAILLLASCTAGGGDLPDPSGPTSSPTPPSPVPLQINEVVTGNEDGLADQLGEHPDWVELWNPGPNPVELEAWTLTKVGASAALPAHSLLPGEFLVIFASGIASAGDEIHLPWRLSEAGETLTLRNPAGEEVDRLVVPALLEDSSWGREQEVAEVSVLGPGTGATATPDPVEGWELPGYDDGNWSITTLPVGFDGDVAEGDETNVAMGQPTSQSSDGYGYTGVQAVDGEPGTFSHTGDGDLLPTWQVDLQGHWLISEVSILNRADCCAERLYNVQVEILDSSGTPLWNSGLRNPVVEGDVPNSPGALLRSIPTDPVVGNAVRVSKSAVGGAGSTEWMSLAEVEVRAVAASPYSGLYEGDVEAILNGMHALGLRVDVEVPLGTPPSRAILDLRYDDGFAMFIDGVEVARADAVEPHDGTAMERFLLDPSLLAPGTHTVAFLVETLDADDLLLAPQLFVQSIESGDDALFVAPTPGEPNGLGIDGVLAPPGFSVARGFFDAPLTLRIDAPAGAELVYTLDGSAPTDDHGTRVPAPASIEIPIETTTLVRARSLRSDWASSEVITHSYFFLDDILRQPASPPGLPETWDGLSESPVSGDYEMDPEIVEDPTQIEGLFSGLRELPTLSVVMAPEDLWDPMTGIYIHSAERGDSWEKATSVELILPDGSTGFAETCGIRIHGYGWRYHSSTKKHSFRLEFSERYGKRKLQYPLFPDAPVAEFDSIVLRAGGSKTWLDFRDPAQAQYLHDSFARDTARDMGKVDGHATFVHLYLNGLYWGLYNPVERPEADFGEEYFGGEDSEYDAINRRTTTNEAVDGTLEAWNTLLTLADADLSTAEGLAAVEAMLDLEDLIDYMLIHQYTVNQDGPCCFESNNMRALRRRVEGERFHLFLWDMEYSLWEPTDDTNLNIDVPGSISHVYTRLRGNPEFRARFAVRAREHLTGAGALTPAAAAARYLARGMEIRNALLAESARWGDTYREPPYTRDLEWQIEFDRILLDFIPRRTEILIEQLTTAGLY